MLEFSYRYSVATGLQSKPRLPLYRSGYHQGISHLHHFYIRRNLIVFSTLWRLTASSPLRDVLRFWLLSYNASHATIMTRVVGSQSSK